MTHTPSRRAAQLAFAVAFVAATVLPSFAAPPWSGFVPFKRVEADPEKSYELTEEQGPWMILATSFAGDGAREEAHQLVLELRRSFKLNAFMHKQAFDHSQSEQGIGLNRYGGPKMMRPANPTRFDEYAVLVGDFQSIEDPKLTKTLEKLKHASRESLKLLPASDTTMRFAELHEFQRLNSPDPKQRGKGPLGSAFVTTNPLLPREMFVPGGLDSLVLEMNAGVKHSLLDCPKKYSVRVATFRGNVIIDQKEIAKIEGAGKKMESQLVDAAEKAHRLTMLLREKGVEAFEFHDRHESIVCIGSFDSVGSPRADGKTEINPQILKIMEVYGAQEQEIRGTARPVLGLQPQRIQGIQLDIQPMPVEVPRRSVAQDYANGNW